MRPEAKFRTVEGLSQTILIAVLPTMGMLLACVVVEYASPMTRYRLRDRFPGTWFIASFQVTSLLLIAPLRMLWDSLHIPPLIPLDGLPAVATFIVLLLLQDFLNYAQHRCDHLILWPVHSMHHSVTELHAANGFAHPLQIISEFVWISLPLSLIYTGGVGMPIALVAAITLQSMIIHSPLRVHLGPLRRVFVDGRFHRIHHSMEERHFDRNFGTVFSLWDQLFGTAYFPAPDEWPETGVAGMAQPRSMRDYLSHPVRFLRSRSGESSEPQDHVNLIHSESAVGGS